MDRYRPIIRNENGWCVTPDIPSFSITFNSTSCYDTLWYSKYLNNSPLYYEAAEQEPALEETPELNEFWESVPITKEEK